MPAKKGCAGVKLVCLPSGSPLASLILMRGTATGKTREESPFHAKSMTVRRVLIVATVVQPFSLCRLRYVSPASPYKLRRVNLEVLLETAFMALLVCVERVHGQETTRQAGPLRVDTPMHQGPMSQSRHDYRFFLPQTGSPGFCVASGSTGCYAQRSGRIEGVAAAHFGSVSLLEHPELKVDRACGLMSVSDFHHFLTVLAARPYWHF
jgi:hypothetical protein